MIKITLIKVLFLYIFHDFRWKKMLDIDFQSWIYFFAGYLVWSGLSGLLSCRLLLLLIIPDTNPDSPMFYPFFLFVIRFSLTMLLVSSVNHHISLCVAGPFVHPWVLAKPLSKFSNNRRHIILTAPFESFGIWTVITSDTFVMKFPYFSP